MWVEYYMLLSTGLKVCNAITMSEHVFASSTARRLHDREVRRKQHGSRALGFVADTSASTFRVHKPSDVFPPWIMLREDFQNMEHLLWERRLTEALETSPYMRRLDEANTLATFITEAWPVARELGQDRVLQLARCVTFEKYAKGDFILEEGSYSRSFYIIVNGSVNVLRATEVVAVLSQGACFGENAVQNGGVTNASCVANTDVVGTLTLTKMDYDNILNDMLETDKLDNMQILKKSPLFSGWRHSRIAAVARAVRRLRTEPGDIIIAQDDNPGNVFFISSGTVALTRKVPVVTQNEWPTGPRSWKRVVRSSSIQVHLGNLERGEHFGERGAVNGSVCFATVTAITAGVLLTLDKNDFVALLEMGHKLEHVRSLMREYPTDDEIIAPTTPSAAGHGPRTRARAHGAIKGKAPGAAK